MSDLHISKVAIGCATLEALQSRVKKREVNGTVPVRTRFRPKRFEELIGGSLYWIIKHRIVARQTILGFENDVADAKTIIRLDAMLVAVRAQPKRAHQGWRYLSAEDAPQDWDIAPLEAQLPAHVIGALNALALI